MAAIITDQLRILNAQNFVSGVQTNKQFLLRLWIGLPNATEISSDWSDQPPTPKDNLDESNDYWDTMIAMKKIAFDDISQVVKKVTWTSGITYDMWRNDIDRDNPSQPSGSFDIYDANYYVLNSDFRVYICLDNNASPENNFQGGPSLDEPTFTDLGQELLVPVVMVIFGSIFTQSNHLKLLGLTQLIIFLFQMSGKPIQLMLPLEITQAQVVS